jgi:hypothetical protein
MTRGKPFEKDDTRINRNGRPQGSTAVTEARDAILSFLEETCAISPEGKPVTRLQTLLEGLYDMAQSGRAPDRIKAIATLFEYGGLKPPTTEGASFVQSTLVPEQEFNRIMREAGWVKRERKPD